MIKRTALIFILLFGFTSCKIETNTPKVKPTPFDREGYFQEMTASKPKNKLTESSSPKKDTLSILPQKEIIADTIRLKFTYGKVKIDTVKTAEKALVFVLDSDTARKLKIEISSQDSLNNLVISQIINSTNQIEGPFDLKTVYEIKEKGEHKIVVSKGPESKDWSGKFSFSAQLNW